MRLLVWLFVLAPVGMAGQNLIPNGDFELGPMVSTTDWAINGPTSWMTTWGTPDRVYEGDILPGRDNDTAQSGAAYVILFGKIGAFDAESGKCTLISPMDSGEVYRLQYYLDIDDNFFGGPAGMTFRFDGTDSINSPIQNNTGQWEYYDTTFIANSAYTEIELQTYGNPTLVKIDNISLEKDSSNYVEYWNNRDKVATIYPNPAGPWAMIALESNVSREGTSVTVYNAQGEQVERFITTKSMRINCSEWCQGIYLVTIQTKNQSIVRKLIKQ